MQREGRISLLPLTLVFIVKTQNIDRRTQSRCCHHVQIGSEAHSQKERATERIKKMEVLVRGTAFVTG
jgi:hypothetical protein